MKLMKKSIVSILIIAATYTYTQAHPGFGYVRRYHENIYYGNPNHYGYVKVCPVRPNVVVVRPACPSPQHIWVDGDWIWNQQANQYLYSEGRWVLAVAGAVWIPGHWKNNAYGWHWVKGHWRYV